MCAEVCLCIVTGFTIVLVVVACVEMVVRKHEQQRTGG